MKCQSSVKMDSLDIASESIRGLGGVKRDKGDKGLLILFTLLSPFTHYQ